MRLLTADLSFPRIGASAQSPGRVRLSGYIIYLLIISSRISFVYNVYLVEVIAGHSIEEIHNVGKAVVGEGDQQSTQYFKYSDLTAETL